MKWQMIVVCLAFLTSCVSKSSFESTEKRAVDAESTLAALRSDLSTAKPALEQAVVTASALSTVNALLESELVKTQSDNENLSRQVQQLSGQVNKLLCDSQISDMKYDNVLDASIILAAWWARQPGVESVGTPYRDKIWTNALSQLHGIRFTSSADHQQYVEHFVVYFDEFNMKPGIFWIGGQCWLDVP